MNEDGDFVFKKFPAKELVDVDVESDDKMIETDPYAGTNIDRSQLGQLQEQALMTGNTKAQVAGETTMEKGPLRDLVDYPKRLGIIMWTVGQKGGFHDDKESTGSYE